MELRLDVGLEAFGGFVAWGEGNVLGGEEGYREGESLANDGVGSILAFDFRSVAYGLVSLILIDVLS